jgi:hypothetical protein
LVSKKKAHAAFLFSYFCVLGSPVLTLVEGFAEAAGEPPVQKFILEWRGFWLELDQEERSMFTGLSFLVNFLPNFFSFGRFGSLRCMVY